MISSYTYTSWKTGGSYAAIRITLPIINDVQQTVPYDGQYTIGLYNTREEQRQAISKVLKPKADL
jgi:hypothetical protein